MSYELHVSERDGSKFKGVKFDNGPGRNRLEIEGEINGKVITWNETGISFTGTLDKDTIQIEFKGAVTEGDGKLSR